MSFGGFGVAYDAIKRAALARERRACRRDARHAQRQQWIDQMLSHHIQDDHQAAMLDSVEQQLENPAPERSGRACPECGQPFLHVHVGNVDLDACDGCGSYWCDKDELRALTRRAADIQTLEGPEGPSRFNCPVCATQMQQHRFLLREDLLVDKCPNDHGIYLERGELLRSLEL